MCSCFRADRARRRSRLARQLQGLVPHRHRVVRSAGGRARRSFTSSRSWRFVVTFSQPIFDGGQRRGLRRLREADVQHVAARAAADCRFRRGRKCGSLRKPCAAPSARSRACGRPRSRRRKCCRITNVAFEAGATTNLEVIDAQRQARDADSAAAVAEDVVRRARLDLLTALGRFPQ